MHMYKPWMKKIILLILAFVSFWVTGFLAFLISISFIPTSQEPADAIVILTGGRGRIKAGFQLLEKTPQASMFISGVNQRAQLDEIGDKPELYNKITIGYKANSTKENAQETKEWLQEFKNLQSLKVVTSHYHVPRSLLELRMTLPGVRLIPYPVRSPLFQSYFWWMNPQLLKMLFVEYNKYILVWVVSKFKF